MDQPESADASSKRQKVVHLSQSEWLLQRPEAFLGAMDPQECHIPDFSGERVAWTTDVLCPGLLALGNELFANALDNCMRDNTQKYIRVVWKDNTLVISNDGSTIPVERMDDSTDFQPTCAFGKFQSGSNFDNEETGKKVFALTSGRNGVGGKGCNVFSNKFVVRIVDAHNKKAFTQTWEENMTKVHPPKITATPRKTNDTTVEWTPDFSRLSGAPGCLNTIWKWLTHDTALCAPSAVKVSFDGDVVKLRTTEHFCRSLGGMAPFATDTVSNADGQLVLRISVAARDPEVALPVTSNGITYGFVNSTRCNEGSHAKYILQKIADLIMTKARAKRGTDNDITVTPSFVRQHCVIVAVLFVKDPRFTSQTKHCLDLPVKDFGWKWEPSASFCSALTRSQLVERAIQAARNKGDADAIKATKTSASRHPSIAKYEPATKLRHKATLLVTEGDSAKNFAVAGLSVVGRRDFGVYPIRGKFLNVRGLCAKTILENKEALELLKILGLQLHTTYDRAMVQNLPYSRLMILADQDVDGTHIAGLLFNLIDTCAPSLLKVKPDFLCRFATSLIRVTLPRSRDEIGFYSQVEYDKWCEARRVDHLSLGTAKYYKGLGTSNAALAKEYFRNLKSNSIVMEHTGKESSEALDLFFNKKRADDRKTVLNSDDNKDKFVDYSQDRTTLERFVYDEMLPQYATASMVRAIPSAVDGFKEALRKVFFGARVLRMHEEISVANAAGKIASRTNYHHRGTAMEDTIIGMAADYCGTANLNLLLPMGQFGSRHKHAAASAAYPKIKLNTPLHELLFPPADDAVLRHVVDEGVQVEPTVYAPVIALALCFGSKGIATGWSTDMPQFHPVKVLDASVTWLMGGADNGSRQLVPWYRGFGGTVVPTDDKNVFLVRGVYEWHGDDLHVLEVPPFKETDAYKESWMDFAGGGILVGDKGTDEHVHLILKNCKKMEDPMKTLGLEKRVTLQNMHLLDATGKLKKYETPHDIITTHAAARLDMYESRLAHLIAKCEREVLIADARARFIDACLHGFFDMRAHEDDAAAMLACKGLLEINMDEELYDNLLSMPYKSQTARRAAELHATAEKKREELGVLREQTPSGVWREELRALRKVLVDLLGEP